MGEPPPEDQEPLPEDIEPPPLDHEELPLVDRFFIVREPEPVDVPPLMLPEEPLFAPAADFGVDCGAVHQLPDIPLPDQLPDQPALGEPVIEFIDPELQVRPGLQPNQPVIPAPIRPLCREDH